MTKPLAGYTERDVIILALTLYGEARGLDVEAQTRVAWTIRNRVNREGWPGPKSVRKEATVTQVCLMPQQFSCWNADDPNSLRLRSELGRYDEYGMRPLGMDVQLNVATAVLEGIVEDISNDADHYHTVARPAWAREWPPYWAKAYGEVARDPGTRGHVFYSSLVKPQQPKSV